MQSGDAVDRSPHQALEMLKCILGVTVVAGGRQGTGQDLVLWPWGCVGGGWW